MAAALRLRRARPSSPWYAFGKRAAVASLTGSPARTLKEPVAALSFSSDARQLLSAGDSSQARLWDLSQSDGAMGSPAVTFQEPAAQNITAVQVQPGPKCQMVTGHSDGRLVLWTWADGKARQATPFQILAEQFFAGAVHAVTFTPDGRYLAAVGDQTMIWLAEMGAQVTPIRNLGSSSHHLEQVNALAIWGGSTPAVAPGRTPAGVPAAVESCAVASADQRQRRHNDQILGP